MMQPHRTDIISHTSQIQVNTKISMGIRTGTDYVRFYLNLEMKDVSLISFVNNEKMVLKSKMENKNLNKERLREGIAILEQLSQEISQIGEKGVLERYGA